MSEEGKLAPIGPEEYILICKKVADKLRDVPGIYDDATAQSFILVTDQIYTKLHKLTSEEFAAEVGAQETAPIIDGGPSAGGVEDIKS